MTSEAESGAENEDGTPPVNVDVRERLAIIRFNRPTQRNALSVATLEILDAEIAALTRRTDISAIIFTGTDDVFAAGANIREIASLTPATAKEFAWRGQSLLQKISDAKQLTIAAVSGYCMGGALDLALACDIRIAAPNAQFSHPGVSLGIITGWGGTQRLPRLIGETNALEMFLTAKRVSAEEALNIGLIDEISENLVNASMKL